MIYRFALLTLALAASTISSTAAHYQVYLLGGQSNGNGRADAAQLTAPLSEEQTDVRLYYRNTQDENSVLPEDQWINLAPGSGHGTTLYYATEFGPEVSFGRLMADAKPTENVAIIKYTYGGTNLYSQWSATGDKYTTFVATVQAGLAALTTGGHTYALRGMLWQQGEADTGGSAADNYQTNLTDLIERVRTDLNGGVAFPFVIGSLSDSQYSDIATVGSGPYKVRQAQEAVAAADATVGIVITDGYGIQSDGIHFDHLGQVALGQGHANQMLALEGPDVFIPVLIDKQPVGESTAPVDTNLVATFNEPIALIDGGTVTLRNLGPGQDIVITLPNAQVSVSGSQLVINPTTDLVAANPYAVRISANAVEDFSNNAFTGIGDDSSWAFSVGNATTTQLIHHWAFDGDATDSAGSADGIVEGGAVFTTSSGGKFGEAISLDGVDDAVRAAAAVMPATDYTLSAWVFWEAGNGERGSIAGGQNSGGEGEVFTMSRATSPSTLDGKLFLNLLPNGTNSITESADNTISANVWQHVAYSVDSTNGTTLYLNGSVVATNALLTTHTPSTLNNFSIGVRPDSTTANPGWFDGLIDDVAIFDGVLNSEQINNVKDLGAAEYYDNVTPPSITALEPDGASGVYPGTNMIATFNRSIALTGGGSVTLTDTVDGTGTVTISLPDPQVTVSGDTLTINPAANLESGTTFEVVISSEAIEDTATTPNAFLGTAAGQWTFSTAAADPTAPLLTAKTPADNAIDVPRGTDIVATFDDDILIGSGDIVIKDLLDGSTTRTIAATDTVQVSISGKVLTIDSSTSLAPDREYAVQFAAGTVRNFSDVPYAGIPGSDVITWNFRTLATSPNVIFILGDDQAWYDYSFMYRPSVEKAAIDMPPANYPVPTIYQVAQTPSIDRLADEGLCYTHGYTPPLCRPSLAAMITGAYPRQTLITGNDPATGTDEAIEARMQVMHPLPRTLADQLGYTSFQTGKWWEGHHTNGGFTAGDTVNSTAGGSSPIQWSGARPSYVTARHGDWGLMTGRVDYVNDVANPAHPIPYANTIQTATDFMDAQVESDQPFLFWYAPFLPHTPHDPPAGLLSKYDALISEPNESGNYFAKYYANIERFDGGVGALLDYLDAKGIADNTIVVFICDNGWINNVNGSSYYARSKQTAYEGGVRTPIIVRWPDRIKPGGAIEPQFITTPVSVVDLVSTIHDALGLATFPEMTGVSLLQPDLVASRDTIFTEDSNHDIADLNDPLQTLQARIAIRDGWKLILPFNNATRTNGTPELYHLYDMSTGDPVDPHEDTNLAGSNLALVGELTTAIEDWYNDRFGFWISHPSRGLAPADRGFNVDPDGDQLANGLEAWFGTHPGQRNSGIALGSTVGLVTTFTHPENATTPDDLTGYYEWSPNLTDWFTTGNGPSGGATVTFSASTSATTTTVTVTATASEAVERIFLRAVVTQN